MSGIEIADSLPKVAGVMNDLAIIRSMTSKEGSHPRASFLLHHGYLPMGGVKFPTLGSQVAQQIGDAGVRSAELRADRRPRRATLGGGGFLGVDYDPFVLQNPEQPAGEHAAGHARRAVTTAGSSCSSSWKRISARVEGADVVADHQKLIRQVVRDDPQPADGRRSTSSKESDKMRDAYGRTQFGAGCLLARRLVEAGVTFVEVDAGGWDTHDDNFNRVRELQLRRSTSRWPSSITDLRERGMLDRTLVIWMGEFGRTPRINARGRPRPLSRGRSTWRWPAAASAAGRWSARPTPAARK